MLQTVSELNPVLVLVSESVSQKQVECLYFCHCHCPAVRAMSLASFCLDKMSAEISAHPLC